MAVDKKKEGPEEEEVVVEEPAKEAKVSSFLRRFF